MKIYKITDEEYEAVKATEKATTLKRVSKRLQVILFVRLHIQLLKVLREEI